MAYKSDSVGIRPEIYQFCNMTRTQISKIKELLDAGWSVIPRADAMPYRPGEATVLSNPEGILYKVVGDGTVVSIEKTN